MKLWFLLLLACAVAALAATSAARAPDANKEASTAAFLTMVKVLNHPRCMNCHTTVDWPTQADDRHRHAFNVARGPEDRGPPGMRCTTCHQDKNQDAANIPGAKDWHMAGRAMGWTGLAPAALCAALLDPKKNGGLTGDKVIEHIRSDRLVLWAWSPGKRTVPPIPHKEFVTAAETWLKKGAHCPTP